MNSDLISVFISYAHKDELLKDELVKHIKLLERQGLISSWHDRKIDVGTDWKGQIDKNLEQAKIIILLISADFLMSDYCYDIEMKRALERHEENNAIVIPVILRPVDWKLSEFARIQALPKDGKPVTTWGNKDRAFLSVAEGIRKAVTRLRSDLPIKKSLHENNVVEQKMPRISNVAHILKTDFIDSNDRLKLLRESFEDDTVTTVTLVGSAGVGKMHLAREYAHQYGHNYTKSPSRGYAFDVAISFANSDLKTVDKLVKKLKEFGVSVHYYKDAEANVEFLKEWLGKSIRRSIDQIYSNARYAIIVYSKNYLESGYALREHDILELSKLNKNQVEIVNYVLDSTQFENLISKDALHIKHTGIKSITLMAKAMQAKVFGSSRISPIYIATNPFPLPFEPPAISQMWQDISGEYFKSALNDYSCAWVFTLNGLFPNSERLKICFDSSSTYEDSEFDLDLKTTLRRHLEKWTSGDVKKDKRLRDEPYGWQVRLESVQYDHRHSQYIFNLSQVKYWHYLATHASLWKPMEEGRKAPAGNPLRKILFERAINDIQEERQNILPCNFSLHMGIISADQHVILRQRRNRAELFPGVWEFGIGEFMHGPDTTDSRFHTFENGIPSLYKFFVAAVREETYKNMEKYNDEIAEDTFKIFGIALEYVTLAPKLIVLHYSPRGKDEIIEGMNRAADEGERAEAIPLTAEAIVAAIRKKQNSGWGPTSKLCLWLALLDQKETQNDKDDASRLLDKCYKEINLSAGDNDFDFK